MGGGDSAHWSGDHLPFLTGSYYDQKNFLTLPINIPSTSPHLLGLNVAKGLVQSLNTLDVKQMFKKKSMVIT